MCVASPSLWAVMDNRQSTLQAMNQQLAMQVTAILRLIPCINSILYKLILLQLILWYGIGPEMLHANQTPGSYWYWVGILLRYVNLFFLYLIWYLKLKIF